MRGEQGKESAMKVNIRGSVLASLFLAMLGFGVVVGVLFPFVVSPFVEWKPGMRIWFSILAIVAGLTVGGVSILLVRVLLLRKINLLSRQLQALAAESGRITSRIDFRSNDDLGALIVNFNQLLERLQSSVKRIGSVAGSVSGHAARTSQISHLLAEGGENKTQLIVDTAISIDGLETSFQKIIENLSELKSSSGESRSATQSQVAQLEKVHEQVGLLLHQCTVNSEGVKAASAASHRTVRHSQELTTALTEAAASMTEMDRTVREIDRNLKETSSISEKVALDAGAGKEATWKTQKGIAGIRESFEASTGVIRTFSEKVKEIAAITEVIDEVTDQTNLLALNAAIIAAQAGEHGRGFAVVADQIKKLADKTSSSTREIGSLIKNFQDQAFQAIDSTGQIEKHITEGVKLSQLAGGSLDSILESAASSHQQIQTLENAIKEITTTSHYLSEKVDSIAGQAEEIAGANREQEESLNKVKGTVTETRSVAGTLSESAEELLTDSRRIREQTDTVNLLVENTRESIQQGEEETGQLVTAIQKMQQLSRQEGETMSQFEGESGRLKELYDTLQSEVERLAPETD
jgi:methyl-accepting chemotaxis protein